MPAMTTETVTRREAALKQSVAALGTDADPLQARKLAKQLRRTQRKRRRLRADDAKRQGQPAEAKEA